MVGDISAWINIQSAGATVVGTLIVGGVYWGLRLLQKWQDGRKPPNPITEETNERLTGLLDAIERENRSAVANLAAAKTTITALEAQLVDEKAAHKGQIADYDLRCSEMQATVADFAIKNTTLGNQVKDLAARVKQLEEAYTAETGKPPPGVAVHRIP